MPTVAELGYPGYEISSWQAVFAPAGTPKDIVAQLNGEIVAMLKTPEVQARIVREGAVPVGSSPEQWSERFKNEVAKWAKVAKSAGLPPRTEKGGSAMFRSIAGITLLTLTACSALAQDAAKDYPSRAIHIVVPFPAGGPADVAARLLAQG